MTTKNRIRDCTDLPHWRQANRRVALIIAAALHDVTARKPAKLGNKTRKLCRTVRDRILERLEEGHQMQRIWLKQL